MLTSFYTRLRRGAPKGLFENLSIDPKIWVLYYKKNTPTLGIIYKVLYLEYHIGLFVIGLLSTSFYTRLRRGPRRGHSMWLFENLSIDPNIWVLYYKKNTPTLGIIYKVLYLYYTGLSCRICMPSTDVPCCKNILRTCYFLCYFL